MNARCLLVLWVSANPVFALAQTESVRDVNVVEQLQDGLLLRLDGAVVPGVTILGTGIAYVETVQWYYPSEFQHLGESQEGEALDRDRVVQTLIERNGRVGEATGWVSFGGDWPDMSFVSFLCVSLDIGSEEESHYVIPIPEDVSEDFDVTGGASGSRGSGNNPCGSEPVCLVDHDGFHECIENARCRERRCVWAQCMINHDEGPQNMPFACRGAYAFDALACIVWPF